MRFLGLVVASALLAGSLTSAGATTLNGASDEAITIHVAQKSSEASDGNSGTSLRPMKTVSAATARAVDYSSKGIPVSVIIHPGIYREAFQIRGLKNGAPIDVTGVGRPSPVISGSELWEDWTPHAEAQNVYSHHWPHDWGLSGLPPGWDPIDHMVKPILRRREMVFADGRLLRQVLSFDELQAHTAAFYVDEERNQIFIHLPPKVDITDTRIEVALRPDLLTVRDASNVTLDGLVFQHAASGVQGSAVTFLDSSNIDIASSKFVLNNWKGLTIRSSRRVSLRAVHANLNGVGGLAISHSSNIRLADTEASFNNWRGDWSNFHAWVAGQKFLRLRDVSINGYRAVGNLAGGLWFDYDNSGIRLEDLTLKGNLTFGLKIEASQGPFSVRQSTMCRNAIGVSGIYSSDVTLSDNLIWSNLQTAIAVEGSTRARPVVDSDTGEEMELTNRDWNVRGNTIASRSTEGVLINTTLAAARWGEFVSSSVFDLNRWRHTKKRRVFEFPDQGFLRFVGWRERTGLDQHSSFRLSRPNKVSCAVGRAHLPS